MAFIFAFIALPVRTIFVTLMIIDKARYNFVSLSLKIIICTKEFISVDSANELYMTDINEGAYRNL